MEVKNCSFNNYPGRIKHIFDDENYLLLNLMEGKYSLLCLNKSKIIDLSNFLPKTPDKIFLYFWNSWLLDRNGRYLSHSYPRILGINPSILDVIECNIFCISRCTYINGNCCFEVNHYDINDDMKNINNLTLNISTCIEGCVTHDEKFPHRCYLSDNKLSFAGSAHVFITKLENKNEYLLSINYNHDTSLPPHARQKAQKYTSYIFNIITLDKIELADYIFYDAIDDNNILFVTTMNEAIVYNIPTKNKFVFGCDKIIEHHKLDIKNVLIGYSHNNLFKYININLSSTNFIDQV